MQTENYQSIINISYRAVKEGGLCLVQRGAKYELQQLLSVIDSIQYKGRVQKRTVD